MKYDLDTMRNELEKIYDESEGKIQGSTPVEFYKYDFIYDFSKYDIIDDFLKELFLIIVSHLNEDEVLFIINKYNKKLKEIFKNEFIFKDEEDFNDFKNNIIIGLDSYNLPVKLINELEVIFEDLIGNKEEYIEELNKKLTETKMKKITVKQFKENRRKVKEYRGTTRFETEKELVEDMLDNQVNGFDDDFEKAMEVLYDSISANNYKELDKNEYKLLNKIVSLNDDNHIHTIDELSEILNISKEEIVRRVNSELYDFVFELYNNEILDVDDIREFTGRRDLDDIY